MDDTIGKGCIYSTYKSSIDRIIVENIDNLDDKLTRMRHDHKELLESGVNVDELSKRYESHKLESKRLLLSVRNTPVCE